LHATSLLRRYDEAEKYLQNEIFLNYFAVILNQVKISQLVKTNTAYYLDYFKVGSCQNLK